jgi:hypothetical protein
MCSLQLNMHEKGTSLQFIQFMKSENEHHFTKQNLWLFEHKKVGSTAEGEGDASKQKWTISFHMSEVRRQCIV